VVGALPDDDLTDILGFDAFRALDEEALRICLNNYRKLPATASDVPPERHFWMLFLRLERWRSNGHFQIELGGEELLLEQLEGASEFTKFAQPQAGSASGGGGRAGSNSLSLSLVLDQSPQPCWVGTRDPPCAKRAVSLGGWGILDIRGVGASVSCGVMHDPPPSPPPPLLPPYAWLRPHPPPLPPPPAASGGSTAHSRGRGDGAHRVRCERAWRPRRRPRARCRLCCASTAGGTRAHEDGGKPKELAPWQTPPKEWRADAARTGARTYRRCGACGRRRRRRERL